MAKIIGGTAATSMYVDGFIAQFNDFAESTDKKFDSVANALKGSASGNPIRIDDVSPLEHEMVVGVNFKSNHIKGELVTTSDFATEHFEVTKTTYSMVVEVKEDELVFYNKVWKGSGELLAGVSGVLSDYFSVGDFACIEKVNEGDSTVYHLSKAYFVDKTVKKYGKNLLLKENFSIQLGSLGSTAEFNNGIITFDLKGSGISRDVAGEKFVLPKGTYTFSCKYIRGTTERTSSVWTGLRGDDNWGVNGSGNYRVLGLGYKSNYNQDQSITFTLTEPQELWLQMTISDTALCDCEYSVLLEVGSITTEFEEPQEPTTYTADENGKVEGIIGNGEAMTLIASSGATITAEYNKDTNKVIEEINQAFEEINQKLTALSAVLINNV